MKFPVWMEFDKEDTTGCHLEVLLGQGRKKEESTNESPLKSSCCKQGHIYNIIYTIICIYIYIHVNIVRGAVLHSWAGMIHVN